MTGVNKGYAFEFFVKQLLLRKGFCTVDSDQMLIYDTGIGQMIHGLGQPHNADVLLSPPFQTPFYFPTRLLIECKCYDTKLGINFTRSVLGLRDDINNFEIVTPDILNNRKNYRRNNVAAYNFERYIYQVALASLSGFKSTAQEFALAHRIPLISFASTLFSQIRCLITTFDEILESVDLSDEEKIEIKRFLRSNNIEHDAKNNNKLINSRLVEWINKLLKEIKDISKKLDIGIIDNGSLIFLIRQDLYEKSSDLYTDGYSLYWESTEGYWRLVNQENNEQYLFELPQKLMSEWAEGNYTERSALDIKETYFKTILIYKLNENNAIDVKFLNLSKNFLNHAIKRIKTLDMLEN